LTHVYENAEGFAEAAVQGFCAVHARIVRPVPGGVLRATQTPRGKVALVIGGGSGHYPAFIGYVGPGYADAAVAGDVFASPATRVIEAVARRAERGAGMVLAFGNYAGDVLNFGFAAERLRGASIDVRVLAITDDIASAPKGSEARRRGVAGDIPILKIAGAAAEAGLGLDEVERLARRANDRTRSFGVAFSGCTLPGADGPLFTVPEGRMAIGLGLHGEPGIDERDIARASELAELLVSRLAAEAPEGAADGGRVAVVLNGLGCTKQEELFGLWVHVSAALSRAGLEPVAPLVGEYATSLDMEGCSLTLTWLDRELEPLWLAPCDTAALRVGDTLSAGREAEAPDTDAPTTDTTGEGGARAGWPDASVQSRAVASRIAAGLAVLADRLAEAEAELGRIDAVAGDGDHGQGMTRGARAAERAAGEAVQAGAGAASTLAAAADAWADRAGGTSGAIWGLGLRSASQALDDGSAADAPSAARAARLALDNVMRLGGAAPGDKTLVDALAPFVERLEAEIGAGAGLPAAWQRAAEAAREAADRTADLLPRLGRARTHEGRSKGHPDAGAISLALAARVVLDPSVR